MAECRATMGRRGMWILVSSVSVSAMIALPSIASAQDVTTTTATVPSTTTTTTQTTEPSATTGATGRAGTDKPKPPTDGRAAAHMKIAVHGTHRDAKVRVGNRVRA